MEFARKQLEKYGWKEGKGLGRLEDGVSEPLRPSKKSTRSGLGHTTASDTNADKWWETVYCDALNSIQIEQSEDGSRNKITMNKLGLKKNKKGGKAVSKYSKNFIKKAGSPSGGMQNASADGTEDEQKANGAKDLTDEQLFAACEGRTTHKGARHGLTASGKLERIRKQEEEFVKKMCSKSKASEESHSSVLGQNSDIKEVNSAIVDDRLTDKENASSDQQLTADCEVKEKRRKKRINVKIPDVNLKENPCDTREAGEIKMSPDIQTRRKNQDTKSRKKKRKDEMSERRSETKELDDSKERINIEKNNAELENCEEIPIASQIGQEDSDNKKKDGSGCEDSGGVTGDGVNVVQQKEGTDILICELSDDSEGGVDRAKAEPNKPTYPVKRTSEKTDDDLSVSLERILKKYSDSKYSTGRSAPKKTSNSDDEDVVFVSSDVPSKAPQDSGGQNFIEGALLNVLQNLRVILQKRRDKIRRIRAAKPAMKVVESIVVSDDDEPVANGSETGNVEEHMTSVSGLPKKTGASPVNYDQIDTYKKKNKRRRKSTAIPDSSDDDDVVFSGGESSPARRRHRKSVMRAYYLKEIPCRRVKPIEYEVPLIECEVIIETKPNEDVNLHDSDVCEVSDDLIPLPENKEASSQERITGNTSQVEGVKSEKASSQERITGNISQVEGVKSEDGTNISRKENSKVADESQKESTSKRGKRSIIVRNISPGSEEKRVDTNEDAESNFLKNHVSLEDVGSNTDSASMSKKSRKLHRKINIEKNYVNETPSADLTEKDSSFDEKRIAAEGVNEIDSENKVNNNRIKNNKSIKRSIKLHKTNKMENRNGQEIMKIDKNDVEESENGPESTDAPKKRKTRKRGGQLDCSEEAMEDQKQTIELVRKIKQRKKGCDSETAQMSTDKGLTVKDELEGTLETNKLNDSTDVMDRRARYPERNKKTGKSVKKLICGSTTNAVMESEKTDRKKQNGDFNESVKGIEMRKRTGELKPEEGKRRKRCGLTEGQNLNSDNGAEVELRSASLITDEVAAAIVLNPNMRPVRRANNAEGEGSPEKVVNKIRVSRKVDNFDIQMRRKGRSVNKADQNISSWNSLRSNKDTSEGDLDAARKSSGKRNKNRASGTKYTQSMDAKEQSEEPLLKYAEKGKRIAPERTAGKKKDRSESASLASSVELNPERKTRQKSEQSTGRRLGNAAPIAMTSQLSPRRTRKPSVSSGEAKGVNSKVTSKRKPSAVSEIEEVCPRRLRRI